MPVGEDHLGRGRKPRRNPEIVWMKRTEAHDDFIISPLMSLFPFFSVYLKKFVSDFGAFVALRITL